MLGLLKRSHRSYNQNISRKLRGNLSIPAHLVIKATEGEGRSVYQSQIHAAGLVLAQNEITANMIYQSDDEYAPDPTVILPNKETLGIFRNYSGPRWDQLQQYYGPTQLEIDIERTDDQKNLELIHHVYPTYKHYANFVLFTGDNFGKQTKTDNRAMASVVTDRDTFTFGYNLACKTITALKKRGCHAVLAPSFDPRFLEAAKDNGLPCGEISSELYRWVVDNYVVLVNLTLSMTNGHNLCCLTYETRPYEETVYIPYRLRTPWPSNSFQDAE